MADTQNKLRIVAISGSLRKGSYNTAALKAAQEIAPSGMTLEIADLDGIPLFNEDIERVGWPIPAQNLARMVETADGLLIATPEYNYSYSAAIKNAIDWLSRTPPWGQAGRNVLTRKPVAVLGASLGRSGSGRAQLHLRQVFQSLDMVPINKPEVFIDHANNKFNTEGHLTDEPTRKVILQLLETLAVRIHQEKK